MPERAATGPIRVLIVDDEPLARDCVRIALAGAADVEIVGVCENGVEAVERIAELEPDLVFLDVQMPALDGFGVVERVGVESMPAVVFVTAYDEHALRAFAVHALDYVLKPFDDERLLAALDRARRQVDRARAGDLGRRLAALIVELRATGQDEGVRAGAPAAARWLERIQVPVRDRIRFVAVNDVDWFEAADNYVRLHVGPQSYVLRARLSELERRLDPARFLRIHRSTLVNLDRIAEVEPYVGGDYIAYLHDGRKLRVSRTYRDALLGRGG